MRFVFHYRAQPSRKQQAVLVAVAAGALRHGDQVEGIEGFDKVHDVDGAILFGIGGIAKQIYDAYRSAGKKHLLIDKGYTRNAHLRVAVNDFQPLSYLQRRKHSPERFEALGVGLLPYRASGTHILFDGASNKFCLWKELGDYAAWGAEIVERIRRNTDLPIIYRPRPTHNEDRPIVGAELSTRPIEEDFARAKIVVSYGGNIGWDAAIRGIPHFAIGDSIARPISETDWTKVGEPYVPSEKQRLEWARAVAWCQWTLDEFRSGEAWAYVREVL